MFSKKIVLVKEWECSNTSTEKIPNGPTQTEKKRLIIDSNSDIGFLGYIAFKLVKGCSNRWNWYKQALQAKINWLEWKRILYNNQYSIKNAI